MNDDIIDALNNLENNLEIKINDKNQEDKLNDLERIKMEYKQIKNFYEKCEKLMREIKIKSLNIKLFNSKIDGNIDKMKEIAQKQILPKKDYIEIKNEVDIDTNIINKKKYYDLINGELKKIYKNFKYELIFRASTDGGFGNVFKKKCSKIRGTLIVIETGKNKRFGGFTKAMWNDSDTGYKEENTFCFSFDENKIYKCNKYGSDIYCKKDCGPIFCDMFGINKNFATEGGYTKDLEIAKTKYESITKDFELSGEEYFDIKEVEVFKINPLYD